MPDLLSFLTHLTRNIDPIITYIIEVVVPQQIVQFDLANLFPSFLKNLLISIPEKNLKENQSENF